VTTSRGPRIHQHDSHAKLIGRHQPDLAGSTQGPALDAVIVPASRPAGNLDHAIALAEGTRSRLVILCSRETRPAEVHNLLAARSFTDAIVIEMPPGYSHPFFSFETSDWIREKLPDACAVRNSDLSIKRNVGLLMARSLGWQRIFFMDDDIRDLDAAALLATVSLLDSDDPAQPSCYSAGIPVDQFPDNSVVCHARRDIGEFQDVFISGSALAVNCTASFAFFPDIYNEDWLFFYRDAAEHKLGSSGNTARQLRYDPYANPRRAAGEEFGDTIAEGLYALLDEGLSSDQATAERWRQFLSDRERIIDEILSRADEVKSDLREKMMEALLTARKCLGEIQPEMCVEYVELWRRDLGRWETTLKEIPRAASIPEALVSLGLAPAPAEVAMS
jgi:glycosyltransferase involved in cell wall biosynthesis